ncbi:[bacterium]|nr:[FeFe] hydrogenase H-cluster radical SAM maturase HydG [bacterium]
MKSLNTEKIFIDREKLYGLIDQKVTDSQVDEVLNRAMQLKGLDLKDAAILLNIKDEKQRNKVFEAAGKAKEIIYGKRIVLFAPLYLGNVCTNNCVYCSFRKDNTALKRAILTDEQIQDETRLLLKMGHKRLLVIGGEARATDVEYYAHSIRKVYETNWNGNTVRRINVEIAPQSEDNFRLLK